MGFFDKFKSEKDIASKEIKKVPWKEITELETLDTLTEDSYQKPVAILKHSTSCWISRMVLRNFEMEYELKEEDYELYFLDLLRYREISNRIASRFNVPHHSPQLIILKDGKVVYDASHNEVTADSLKPFLS